MTSTKKCMSEIFSEILARVLLVIIIIIIILYDMSTSDSLHHKTVINFFVVNIKCSWVL